ncbi:MAG: NosD domain-containing protein [Thermoplasmata archaeon]
MARKTTRKLGLWNHRLISVVLLSSLLLSAAVMLMQDNAAANPVKTETKTRGKAHAPIHINGNADFANQAANEGWQGNGTPENPYIIYGYEINGAGNTYCIWIANTDVHFIIHNCTVYGATLSFSSANIILDNVTNGRIENTNSNGSKYGFLLVHSTHNILVNNTALGEDSSSSGNAYAYGIYLFFSSNNTIAYNSASGNGYGGNWGAGYGYGIYLSSSSTNIIKYY